MGFLTDWLEAYKLTGYDRHPVFPFLSVPPGFKYKSHKTCQKCPQDGKPGHVNYACGKMTLPQPVASTPNLWAFRAIQYLPSRISSDIFPHYGAGSFMYYGFRSINFSETYNFRVVAASGNVVTITSDGAGFVGAIHTERKLNWGTTGSSFLSTVGYRCQPNDRAKPGAGSILDSRGVVARVRKVIFDRTADLATVELDQDFTHVMTDNREDQTTPFTPGISFLRHAAEPEGYTPVVDPSELKTQKRVEYFRPANFPEDLRFNLTRYDGTDGRIADPEEDPERPQVFKVWRKQVDPEPTEEIPEPEPAPVEDITSLCFGRLKMFPVGPGTDGRGAYRTLLCMGTLNWDETEAFAEPLVTEETEYLKIIYHSEVAEAHTGDNHCAPGGRRCVHSVRDLSGSFYDMDDGEAIDAAGESWHCAIRRTQEVIEITSGPDAGKWGFQYRKPSGIALYTPDCQLYGICNGYTNIAKGAIGQRALTLDGGDANQILKEVTIGHNIALVQYYPGYGLYYVKRVGRPTIHGLTTGSPTMNPVDWSATFIYVQDGNSIVGDFQTGPDGDGGTILNPLSGGVWDARTLFSELTFPAAPPAGMFPTLITDWGERSDALRRAYTDTTDPYKALRYYEDDSGLRTGRLDSDAGAFGRGVSQAIRKIGAAEGFIFEALDVSEEAAGNEQERKEGTFKILETVQAGPFGFDYAFTFTFKNLLPEGGEPKGAIKEAKIMKVEVNGTEVTLHLENQPRTYSRLKNIGLGNSFNEVFTINAGGGVVRPPDFLQIRSSETSESSYGGIQDWVTIGDNCSIEHNATGFTDFNLARFCVVNAVAYNGDKAPNFGATSDKRFVYSNLEGGYHEVPVENLEISNGSRGRIVASEATTAEAYDAAEQTLTTVEIPPFRYFQWLQVDGTGEIIQALSVDGPNRQTFVARGTHGTTAQPIPAGAKLKLIMVFDPATHTIFTAKTGETKPSLDPGEYWIDEQAARIYIAPADYNRYLDVAYYVDKGGENNPADSYLTQGARPYYTYLGAEELTSPFFSTDVNITEFIGTGAPTSPQTKVFLDTNEVTLTATNPPTDEDTYTLYEDPATELITLIFARTTAGKGVRLEIAQNTDSSGNPVPFALDIADTPEFATGEKWGLKMDTVTLADENGWLVSQAAFLVGKTAKFGRHELRFSPDSELTTFKFTQYKEDAYETEPLTNFLFERGRGILYGNQMALDDFREIETQKICAEIT